MGVKRDCIPSRCINVADEVPGDVNVVLLVALLLCTHTLPL